MSTPPGSGSGSWIVVQASINVALSTYDLNALDQIREFQLFKHHFTPWKKIHHITTDEVDYLPSILSKEGYVAMDCWVLTDAADINDTGKFLIYLEITLDDEISLCVRFYELEDIKKRTDEMTDALVELIHRLACHEVIGDGRDPPAEFEVQCRLIRAILDGKIELQKELLKISCDKGVSNLPEIHHTYYVIEYGTTAMCAGKGFNAV